MAVTPNSFVTPQGINDGAVTFVNADGTTAKTLLTAGANGTWVSGLAGTTNDTSANNVAISLNDGSTSYLVGTVRLATLSGTDGAANAISLLNTTALPWLKLDPAGNPGLFLKAGWTLKVNPLVAVTAAKTLTLLAKGEDL